MYREYTVSSIAVYKRWWIYVWVYMEYRVWFVLYITIVYIVYIVKGYMEYRFVWLMGMNSANSRELCCVGGGGGGFVLSISKYSTIASYYRQLLN